MSVSAKPRQTRRSRRRLSVGDVVVYPPHGVGTVTERSLQKIVGERREYLTVVIVGDRLTLKVPAELAPHVGLRPIASPTKLHKALDALADPPEPLAENWRTRRKQALSKLASGDVMLLAEVVRDLSHIAAPSHWRTTTDTSMPRRVGSRGRAYGRP